MSVLSELFKKENWRIWIKGLVSAAVSGGASGIVVYLTTPQTYSISQLFWVSLVAGTVGAALYIKKSPIPEGL